ncbi:hypothetical protein ACFFSY_05865 [Paenibacillus aurantiacus]|uniref:Uncharacterized protein n=1 Tax=Paenibacillus aurantiacus TaxID=1936118 RepID=A0ABV5KJQ4_9BACL
MTVAITALIDALHSDMDRSLSMAAAGSVYGTPEAVAWAASASDILLCSDCDGAKLVLSGVNGASAGAAHVDCGSASLGLSAGGDGATTEEKTAADKRPAAMMKKPSERSLGFLCLSCGNFRRNRSYFSASDDRIKLTALV